jgi:SAM-dependent methyltransferase
MPGRRPFGWSWNELGKRNALGAIVTVDGNAVDWDIGEFLATGRAETERFMRELRRVSPEAPRDRVLDFGCGVGRITRPLAEHFRSVVGADVAASMLARARLLHPDCDRITWIHNPKPHLRRFPDSSFDVIYSRLVLQHIRPRIVERYLAEFIRVLAPGGVLMFQLPEAIPRDPRAEFLGAPAVGTLKRKLPTRLVRAWRSAKYPFLSKPLEAEMFGVDRRDVERVIARSGGRLLRAEPDASHGPHGRGFEYWVTR